MQTPRENMTLEQIALRKAELLRDIRTQKEKITTLTQGIFAPLAPPRNKANALMRSVNTGIALWEGIMTGVKIMRKMRRLFRK